MEDLVRSEYPSILASLQPNQAVHTLNDRVKRINKINVEIADWLQERRRVEEQYVTGLRKLAQFRVPNSQSELGVFQHSWSRMVESAEIVAHSHHQFSERVERDIEFPLRNFHQRKDVVNINNISQNLAAMAKALEDAQHTTEKMAKKGGRPNPQKVTDATAKLESATQQWDSQAPFIFETLQALDESRINVLRDLLTQYQTHEADCAQKVQDNATEVLTQVIEVSTETEIRAFATRVTAGKARLPTRSSTRRSSVAGSTSAPPSTRGSAAPPSLRISPEPTPEVPPLPEQEVRDAPSPPPIPVEPPKPESKLRRLGTILGGRRRQSMVGGFGLSPQKPSTSTFGRLTGKDKSNLTTRASSGNLRENRLNTLEEAPDLPRTPDPEKVASQLQTTGQEHTNGVTLTDNIMDSPIPTSATNGTFSSNANTETTEAQGSTAPTTQNQTPSSPVKDSEGFTIPSAANDPISEAQREAHAEEAEQLFKLNIHTKPIEEEDPEEKQAALSNVANSLRLGPATRRTGTIRGRRDVRNTIYSPTGLVPPPAFGSPDAMSPEGTPTAMFPGIPASPSFAGSAASSKPTAISTLQSEASIAGTSDTQSVRSGNSLGSLAHVKHPDMPGPGLHSSIIETVSAVWENGGLKSVSMSGEIAFVINSPDHDSEKEYEVIRINNFPNLERIGPNRIFVQNSSIDHPEQFALEISHLQKTSTAFSYRVFSPENDPMALSKNTPLLLNPVWKPQGDKLGLLLQFSLNPDSDFEAPLTLHNVVFVATYEGRATGAQTRPSGTHLKERHIVYWRLDNVTLTNDTQKIVCRILGAEGVEPQPGHVEARWEYAVPETHGPVGSGISISRLEETKGKGKEISEDDPFATDEDGPGLAGDQTWVQVPLVRKLASGKYEGR
ncbi:unnamed protein product [Clonostachys chloroleuca]|uniref:MHD domain-containing protein n=1 Tax=Clonostachys chloroleuca TaxID=1926264 RepID=A0AA35M673_9HYPO|nr:unnamed protein product [Clonostachys chloroleuca]